MLEVLEPFEIGDGHTTCVAENIRKETDSFGEKNLFGSSCGWTVGSFDDELALELVSVVSVDGLFEGSRDEEIARL